LQFTGSTPESEGPHHVIEQERRRVIAGEFHCRETVRDNPSICCSIMICPGRLAQCQDVELPGRSEVSGENDKYRPFPAKAEMR